jgi:hypothetical protein
MNKAVIKLHFTLGNQGDAFHGLATAVSMDCAYIKMASINLLERHYIVCVMGTSLKELTDIAKYENIDIDITEAQESDVQPKSNS